MAGDGDKTLTLFRGKSSKIGCYCFEEGKGYHCQVVFDSHQCFNILFAIRKNEDQVKRLSEASKPNPPDCTTIRLFYNQFHNVMTNIAIREKQNNDGSELDEQVQDSASQTALDLIGDPNVASDPSTRRELANQISQKTLVQVRNQDGTTQTMTVA